MVAGPTLSEGVVLDDDYRIVRPLGGGGMGAIYEAEQISTGRRRALKVMHPQLVPDAKSRVRFQEEARIGARIPSEHVIEVVGAGVDEATGLPYLAMELLEGEDLAQTIEREGPLPVEVVKELMLQTGHALAAAHALGVVHRDLKPENLFIAKSRRRGASLMVKVLDFGIAATMQESRDAVTATSAIGSPLFMAPEQSSPGMQLRASTDVWALGLIAFHALTGRIYWTAANIENAGLQALLAEVLVHPLEPASERARRIGFTGALPPGFDAWFAACVAREPERRFAEAGACVAELERVLGGHGASGLAPTVSASMGGVGASAPGASTGPIGSSPPAVGWASAGSGPPPGWGSAAPSSSPGALPSTRPGFGGPSSAPPPVAAPARARSSGFPGVVLVLGAVAFVALIGGTMLAGILIAQGSRGGASDVVEGSDTAAASASEGSVGLLTVTSDDPATVLLDGHELGRAPILQRRVAAGNHELTFVHDDGRRTSRSVSIGEGSIVMVNEAAGRAAPAPAPAPTPAPPEGDEGTGTVVLQTIPWATVTADGRTLGVTPLTAQLPAGTRTLVFETADGRRVERPVRVRPGETVRMNLTLEGASAAGGDGAEPSRAGADLPDAPSRGDVVTAMRALAPAVQACGGSGLVNVRVTFASTGHVVDAQARTAPSEEVRRCAETAARSARVPPFRRESFSVSYPFRL